MYKLKTIAYLSEVLPIVEGISSDESKKVIYQIQNIHLKHTKKKDFSPIVYKLANTTVTVKFHNSDFYNTSITVSTSEVEESADKEIKSKYCM